MISYDSYVKKIKKVKSVKNTIYRFRVLIITVLSVITFSSTGFLVSKGLITQNVSLPNTIVYGETYGIKEAKALFSKITYEFTEKGEDNWSKEKPTLPGDYSVRAVTEKNFNAKGYGKVVDFTILPKPVDLTVTSSSIIYGDDPQINTSFLVEGDRLESVKFEYENIIDTVTKVNADKESVVIRNKEGQDVSAFYEFKEVKSDITINPKDIIIKPSVDSKTYDGLSVDYDNELEEKTTLGLVDGDEISFETIILDSDGKVLDSMPKDAGTYTLQVDTATLKIFNSELNVETSGKYNLFFEATQFTISPREITISPEDFEDKVYDGVEYSYKDEFNNFAYSTFSSEENKLVDGESIKVKVNINSTSGYSNILNADNYILTIGELIAGENTNLNNYKITKQKTNVVISRREVTLYPLDYEDKVYDGIEYVYKDEFNNFLYKEGTSEENKLVDGEELKVKISVSSIRNNSNILSADSYVLSIDSIEVNDKLNLNNYIIIYKTQEVLISKREIEISLLDINEENKKIYDGNYIDYDESSYEITSELDFVGEDNIAFDVLFNNMYYSVKDAGKYNVEIANHYFTNGDENNYALTFKGLEYEIEPRPINIIISEFDNLSKVYDGVYVNHDNTWTYEEDSLHMVDGEELYINVIFENEETEALSVKNASAYKVKVKDYMVLNGSNSNYAFSANEFDYLIEKRNVTIRPYNFDDQGVVDLITNSEVYNGLTYTYDNNSYNNFVISDGEMVQGEAFNALVVVEEGEVKDAGTYTLKIVEDRFDPNYDMDMNNYNITIEDVSVQFTIEKREITIAPSNQFLYYKPDPTYISFNTDGDEKEYDGIVYRYSEDYLNFVTTKEYGVVDNEFIRVSVRITLDGQEVTEIKDAGNYEIEILSDLIITDENTKLSNYIINIDENKEEFLINKRNLKVCIVADNLSKVYDGQEVRYFMEANNFYCLDDTSVVPSEELMMKLTLKDENASELEAAVNAGVYTLTYAEMEGLGDTKVSNYEIVLDQETVNFEIFRRDVYVYFQNINETNSHIYDGTYVEAENVIYTVDNMVEGENLIVNTSIGGLDKVKDAGEYYVGVENAAGNESKENDDYEVENGSRHNYYIYHYGYMYIIEKRDITIRPYSFFNPDLDMEKPTVAENSEVYNGLSYVYEETYNNFVVLEGSIVEDEGIIAKVEIYNRNFELVDEVKNSDDYHIRIVENDFETKENTNLENYNITISGDDVIFYILRREVIVDLFDIEFNDYGIVNEKEYDGKEVTFNEKENEGWAVSESSPYPMVEGEILTIDVKFDGLDSVKDVKVDYSYDPYVVAPYIVYVESYFVENGLVDNYIFSADTIEFTIKQRQITISPYNFDLEEGFVTLKENSEVYDGTVYEYLNDYENFIVESGSIVEGERIKAAATISCDNDLINSYGVKNAGTYTIDFLPNGYEFFNTLETNYNITVSSPVIFVIETRKITLFVNDLFFEESGEYNHKIYDGITTWHNGTYQDLEEIHSLLPSEPLTVTVSFENVETKEYSYSIKNAGQYRMDIKEEDMYLPEGCFLSNYEFNIQSNLVTIEKRAVSLKLDRFDDYMYDGTYRTYDAASYTVTSSLGIVDGESILLDVRMNGEVTVKDAGDYLVKVSSLEGNETGLDDGVTVIGGLRSNYIFEVDEFTFSISKRPVSIRPYNYDYYEEFGTYGFSYEKENTEYYNGVTYAYPVDITNNFVYEEGSLALVDGEYFKVEIDIYSQNGNTEIKNVDEYRFVIGNIVDTINFNENNYDLTLGEAKLIINKRPIQITTLNINETNSKIYDAEVVEYEIKVGNFEVLSGSLVNDENFIIEATFDGNLTIVDADPNPYPITISKVTGTSVTDINNYDIDYSDVKYFTIDPRPISIVASNKFINDETNDKAVGKDEISYNGHFYSYSSAPNNFGYLENSLEVVGEDKLEAIVKVNDIIEYKYKNAGSYEHVISEVIALGETKKTNYVIDFDNIYTFTINPRKLTIRPYTFDYENGTSSSYSNKEDYNGHTYIYDNEGWNNFLTGATGVVEGENINVKVAINGDVNTEVKNVGTYILTIVEDQYTFGPNTIASNYEIAFDIKQVSFTIEKRKVSIELDKLIDKTYDGIAVDYDENVFTYSSGSMVEGEDLEIEVMFDDLLYDYVTSITAIDASDYSVIITNFNVINGLNSNYEFTQTNTQVYKINKRSLKITPDYINEKIYDGLYSSYSESEKDNFKIVEGSFVEEESIGIKVSFNDELKNQNAEVKDVGVYDMTIIAIVGYGNFKNNNYDIKYINKEFKITPREVELTLNQQLYGNDGIWEYSGEWFIANSLYTVTDGSICEGDTIRLNIRFAKEGAEPAGNVKDVGEYSLVLNDYFVNEDINQKKNYNVKVVGLNKTVLTIVKRVVRVKLNNINEENQSSYNKQYIDFDETNYVLTTGSMVSAEGLRFEVKFKNLETEEITDKIINTGLYEVFIPEFTVINNGDINNYDIQQVDIFNYEIKKRDVYLTLADRFQDKVYDGIYYESTGNYYYTYMDRPETWLLSGDSFNPFEVEFENVETKQRSNRVANVGTYKVIRTPSQNDDSLLENYNIIFSNANEESLSDVFTISTREINIKVATEFISGYYGDVSYYYEENMYEYEEKDEQFFNNHTFKLRVLFNGEAIDAINAGLYVVTLNEEETVLYRDEDYESAFGNCKINIVGLDKEFEIYRRPISVEIKAPENAENLIYDGKGHNIEVEFMNMAYNEKREVSIDTQLSYYGLGYEDMPDIYLEIPVEKVISMYVDEAIDAGTYFASYGNVNWGKVDPNNYDFDIETDVINNSSFEIKPRPIIVSPSTSSSFTYGDMTYQARDRVSVSGGMPNKEGFTVVTELLDENMMPIDKAVESGRYYERIIEMEPKDGTKTTNYEITIQDSSFTVYKRKMAIETIIDFKEYDGLPYQYDCASSSNYVISDDYEYRSYYQETAYDEVFKISGVGYYDMYGNYTNEPIDIGYYRTVIDGVVMVECESEKGIDNYEIVGVDSYIEITKRLVSIKLLDFNDIIYDGIPRVITNEFEYAPMEDGKTYTLPEGYTLKLNNKFVNENGMEIEQALNVGFYSIDYSGYEVLDENGNNCNDMFEVRMAYCCGDYLQIRYRQMHIKPVYVEKTYDGTELKAPEYEVEPVNFTTPLEYYVGDDLIWYREYGYHGLLPGHHIRVETSEVIEKATTKKTNEIVYYEIYDDYGNIIQSSDTPNVCYDVVYNAEMLNMPENLLKASYINKVTKLYQQTIKINKRVVTMTPYDVSQIYGDESIPDFIVNFTTNVDEGLVAGHSAEAYILNADTKAPGTYDTAVKYNIYDENGYKVTNNYKIVNTKTISFVVAPKVITITVGSASKKYNPADNSGLSCDEFTISEEDQAFLDARKLLIDCVITGFIQTPGVAVNTIKNPSEDVTIYKIVNSKLGTTKEYTHCFEFIINDGQLVMYE